MKKILIITIILVALCTTVYYFFLRRTPYTIASIVTGFKVTTSLNIETFQDNWANNLGGDGELLILFSFKENEKEKLVNNCISNNYKPLPINDTLPDNFIYRYVKKENQTGYYKLVKDKKDERNYQISVLNLQKNELIVYSVIY